MAKKHVFISHASPNDEVAERVVRWLQKAGRRGWLDQHDILPARNWRNEVHRGVRSASALIVLISAASRRSQYVREEWKHAMSHGVAVIPAVIGRDTPIPSSLRHLQRVDLRHDDSPGWKQLLTILRPANLRLTGPVIRIEFDFEWEEPKMTDDGEAYEIVMTTENVPPETRLVKYELLDPSYPNPIRQSSNRTDNFEAWTTAWGDVPIVARGFAGPDKRKRMLWTARAEIAAALEREYGRVKRHAVRRALRTISTN
jgi:hypothetical protein